MTTKYHAIRPSQRFHPLMQRDVMYLKLLATKRIACDLAKRRSDRTGLSDSESMKVEFRRVDAQLIHFESN